MQKIIGILTHLLAIGALTTATTSAASQPCINEQLFVTDTAYVEPNVVTVEGRAAHILFTIYPNQRPPSPWHGAVLVSLDGEKRLAVSESVIESKPVVLTLYALPKGAHVIDVAMRDDAGGMSTSFHACVAIPGHRRITHWRRWP